MVNRVVVFLGAVGVTFGAISVMQENGVRRCSAQDKLQP